MQEKFQRSASRWKKTLLCPNFLPFFVVVVCFLEAFFVVDVAKTGSGQTWVLLCA